MLFHSVLLCNICGYVVSLSPKFSGAETFAREVRNAMNSSFGRKQAAAMGALVACAIGTSVFLVYLSPAIARHVPSIL
jgi:hypothetical protein